MGLAGSPGCPLTCRDGPAAMGLIQIGRTLPKPMLLLFMLSELSTSVKGLPVPFHKILIHLHCRYMS